LRGIVVETLGHFDEERYRLGGYVVMPNHAHVLVQCLGETRLKGMGYSWKHYTARQINKVLANETKVARESLRVSSFGEPRQSGSRQSGSRANFWQGETYDHIVRSQGQFEHYRRYLEQNPVKARLRADEYALFLPEVEGAALVPDA
jgi:menaquinone-specific isochorismate synthase